VRNNFRELLPLARKNRHVGTEARPGYAPTTHRRGDRNILNKPLKKVRNLNLGLSIVNTIVGTLGGKIDFQSTLDEGTCFRVCLPCKPL